MAVAGNNTGKQLDFILSCCVCLDRYNTTEKIPKALPCQHTFCVVCLDGLEKVVLDNGLDFKCPKCKAPFDMPRGAQNLPTNFSVQDMLELNFQERPSKDGGSATTDQKKEAGTEEATQYMCEKHGGKTIVMVCRKCSVGLCAGCMKTKEHADHEWEEVEEYLAEFNAKRESIEKRCTELRVATIKRWKKSESEINTTHKMKVCEIDMIAEEAIKKVREWQARSRAMCAEEIEMNIAVTGRFSKTLLDILDQTKSSVSREASPQHLPNDEQVSRASKELKQASIMFREHKKIMRPMKKLPALDFNFSWK